MRCYTVCGCARHAGHTSPVSVHFATCGPRPQSSHAAGEWEHVLGIDPLSPDHITLELVDLLNDTAWKVVQAGDLLLLDIGHMGVYDDASECRLPYAAAGHSTSQGLAGCISSIWVA